MSFMSNTSQCEIESIPQPGPWKAIGTAVLERRQTTPLRYPPAFQKFWKATRASDSLKGQPVSASDMNCQAKV